jgi:DNA polymerase-3 subunit gamma/tau
VRLLDLVSAALEATSNGAQARIQLDLVLVKAAAPQLDPSMKALLARIERLEAGHRTGPGGGLRAVAAPEEAPAAPAPAPRTNGAAAVPTRADAPPAAARVAPAPDEDVAALPALDIPAAVELWTAAVEQVRVENKMLASLLKDARPVRVSDHELELAFPSGAAFLKRKAEQEDHRRAAAEALHAVSGRALTLRYELGADEVAGEADATVLSGEELVQRFLQEFDAEEVEFADANSIGSSAGAELPRTDDDDEGEAT